MLYSLVIVYVARRLKRVALANGLFLPYLIQISFIYLVLSGDSAVGKSSVVERFVKNEYFEFNQPTIGASFFAQTIKISDGNTVKFEIWDTAGTYCRFLVSFL
jgi:hypothetical protein